MALPVTLHRKSTAALQLCYLLVRPSRKCISTSRWASLNEGRNVEVGNSSSEENDVKQQTYIDYSVLPIRKKKTEIDYDEGNSHDKPQDVSRKESGKSEISKSMVTNIYSIELNRSQVFSYRTAAVFSRKRRNRIS